jgi:lipopolysaccharide/colanic/teichoic acid biosynthesis glycosyltransferase
VRGTAAARYLPDNAPDADINCLSDPVWKRGLDIVVAATLLALTAPVWAVAMLLIKLDSPGPVFYVQKAIGRGGRAFRFYKFRTMCAGNDDEQHHRYVQDFVRGEAKADDETGSSVFKMKRDPRITRSGRLLRKLSLDELPQLLNVVKGNMSLVGPRPPLPYEYELYDAHAKQRLRVRPGITGLYQITARSRAPFDKMVRIDVDYIRRRSLWLDLSIIVRTPFAMIFGRGAY